MAAPLYTGDGNAGGWSGGNAGISLTTDAPWNGTQALRVVDPADGGPHLLGAEDDSWFRARLRFNASSFTRAFTFFQFGRYSGPGNLMVGVTQTPSPAFHIRETWNGTDYYPTLVAMDDEAYWDVILHMVRAADGTGLIQMNAWVGASNGGPYTAIWNATVANETMTDPWRQNVLYIQSPNVGDRVDWGSWETADGATTPNPFGALP